MTPDMRFTYNKRRSILLLSQLEPDSLSLPFLGVPEKLRIYRSGSRLSSHTHSAHQSLDTGYE